jgi:putative transposase
MTCLTVVDEWTREALTIDVTGSIRSGRVLDGAGQAGQHERRSALRLRSDNGPEFVSTAVRGRLSRRASRPFVRAYESS